MILRAVIMSAQAAQGHAGGDGQPADDGPSAEELALEKCCSTSPARWQTVELPEGNTTISQLPCAFKTHE